MTRITELEYLYLNPNMTRWLAICSLENYPSLHSLQNRVIHISQYYGEYKWKSVGDSKTRSGHIINVKKNVLSPHKYSDPNMENKDI